MNDQKHMPRVLITGGSGLIGQNLQKQLEDKDYEVILLSRNSKKVHNTASYAWDIDRDEIDREALNSCDYIIHLAGANIGAKRWTSIRKQEILDSRIKSAEMILKNIDTRKGKLKAFISSSAVGYYGAITSDHIYSETDPPGSDFLGQTCKKWEDAADKFNGTGIRTVMIRTGVVFSRKGGALSKFNLPVKLGFASALGSGKQYMPWVHIDDLGAIYIHALENIQMEGAYNAVAPEHITNKDLTRKIARLLHKPFWAPNIPAFAMKFFFGEMAAMLLQGSRVSSDKIRRAGFVFQFPDPESALTDLL